MNVYIFSDDDDDPLTTTTTKGNKIFNNVARNHICFIIFSLWLQLHSQYLTPTYQPTHRKQSTQQSVCQSLAILIHSFFMNEMWGDECVSWLVGWLAGGSIHNIQRHILDHHGYPLHSLHFFYVVLRVFALCLTLSSTSSSFTCALYFCT